MTKRIPQFTLSDHSRDDGELHLMICRVDGSPSRDGLGQLLRQSGASLEELVAELRRMLERLRAADEASTPRGQLGPVAFPPCEPVPFDASGYGRPNPGAGA